MDRIVLIGHPCLLFRVHVPQLLDGTSWCPVVGNEKCYILVEDRGVDCRAGHGVKALIAELRDIETLIVLSTDLVGSFACHLVISLTFCFSCCAFSLSSAAGTYRRAHCTTIGLRFGHNESSITADGAARPNAFTVNGHGTTRSQDDGNDDSNQGQDNDPKPDLLFVFTTPRNLVIWRLTWQ